MLHASSELGVESNLSGIYVVAAAVSEFPVAYGIYDSVTLDDRYLIYKL